MNVLHMEPELLKLVSKTRKFYDARWGNQEITRLFLTFLKHAKTQEISEFDFFAISANMNKLKKIDVTA